MSLIRFIVELDPQDAGIFADNNDLTDDLTDKLIDAFGTPTVSILDLAEDGEPAWFRSGRF